MPVGFSSFDPGLSHKCKCSRRVVGVSKVPLSLSLSLSMYVPVPVLVPVTVTDEMHVVHIHLVVSNTVPNRV